MDHDGDNTRYFDDTMREVELERSHIVLGDNRIDKSGKGEMNSFLLRVGNTIGPDEVKVPK